MSSFSRKILYLFALLFGVGATTCSAKSYEEAKSFAKKMRGSVLDQRIDGTWSVNEEIFFFQTSASQIQRVDTATGKISRAFNPQQFCSFFDGKIKPSALKIERFSADDAGSFVCLVSVNRQVKTLQTNGQQTHEVDLAQNPFALKPRPKRANLKSSSSLQRSKIFFVNNTDQTAQVQWIDQSGISRPFPSISPGKIAIQSTFQGHRFLVNNMVFTATEFPAVAYLTARPQKKTSKKKSPPASTVQHDWCVFFEESNVWIKNRAGTRVQLTQDGKPDWKYRGSVQWSPDHRYFVAWREKAGTNRHVDLIEAAPKDQLQPKRKTIFYQKAGDDLFQRKPCLFDTKTQKQIPLDDALFSNPWRISALHWTPESDRFFLLYNERGHQILRLLSITAATGSVKSIIEERSKTFIDYTYKTFLRHLDATDEVLWMSERDGWNHLYLIDRKTGRVKNQITQGNWVVRGVDRVDEEKRQIWFHAGGIVPQQDPYFIHYARINFDGTGLTLLTQANGTHTLQFSPDRRFYIDTYSRVDQPPIHELHRTSDGGLIQLLRRADASKLLALHSYLPEPFVAKGRDRKTNIYGVIYRPSNFDPTQKYPVVEKIYAGPHGQFVPKAFRSFHDTQLLAERGFIVVQIDGMGTNWRSRKFHDVCWKNLKDAGFPDRIAWMKAAAKKYPFMDLSRVGIYGGSAGGQNAMRAVLDHADFYKVAATDCGCHDNRMDKIWWNEAWMGWPVDESYIRNSNAVDAHKLGGKLLLTVGALDSNVDPSTTMQVVDALIKANKDFDLIVFPSLGHGAGESDYGNRRRQEFFIHHLR